METDQPTVAQNIDLLIEARWVLPIAPPGGVLEHHAVAIDKGRILAVLPIPAARQSYAATETVSLPEHALLPGLINLHAHTPMTLLRGIADDLPLMRWLNEAIWPAERQHVSPEFVYDGTLLGAAEMLAGGITTVADMYFYPDAAARAYADSGLRAHIGLTVIEHPTRYASDPQDYLTKGLAVRDQWRDHPLIHFSLAPHAPYTVSNTTFERIGALAQELDILIQLHTHETQDEIQQSLKEHGVRPLARLDALGLLGPNLLLAHCVHLTPGEVELLARHNVSVAHNPVSNMKLASGIAPVSALQAAGVNVGLGSDGAASNNRQDILQEMRMASLLAKVSQSDAAALPAERVLQMATLDAAHALNLGHALGSISPGKLADLCAINLGELVTTPCYNVASHLVFVAGREHVSDVWVNGERRLKNGVLLQKHNKELLRISRLWQNSLMKQGR